MELLQMPLQSYRDYCRGKQLDESRYQNFDMVDENEILLDIVTDRNQSMDLQLHQQASNVQKRKEKSPLKTGTSERKRSARKPYKKFNDEEKDHFFFLVNKKIMTAGKAARRMGIPRRTAYSWLKKRQEKPCDEIQPSKKTAGRPPIFNEIHKDYLLKFINNNPLAVLKQIEESVANEFSDITVCKSTLYDFMTKKCGLTLERAHLNSKKQSKKCRSNI